MNYGGDAADQIVKYSLDGLDHSLRLSGTLAKNLAVFFAAVLKDQKKTYGKTRLVRMLRENKPLKFFTVPSDRLKEFAKEGKKRGLLYVVIKDKKNPGQCEVMVFADDAAKVNRVMDKMCLDFLKSESAMAVHEVESERAKEEVAHEEPVRKEAEKVIMPEGEVWFEMDEMDEVFGFEDPGGGPESFPDARGGEKKSPSEPSSRSKSISAEESSDRKERPSVRRELEEIKKEKADAARKREPEKVRSTSKGKIQKKRRRKKMKGKVR